MVLPMFWIKYIALLFYEVVIANFQVAKIVLNPKLDIKPMVIEYESKLSESMLLTILANSITLTPGTMTVGIEGKKLQVHCLRKFYAESLQGNKFEKQLLKIESLIRNY